MYIPKHFAADDAVVQDLLVNHGAANLVTNTADPAWLDALVRRLTGKHEAAFAEQWSVDDAPEAFVAGQLRAIVGVELVISRIEAKAKLSQNRPEADIEGVIASLDARGETESADAVRAAKPSH
ncbi:hypothetical protein GCM10009789_47950 [Kribbella sancticallisti]|uniref:Uncharacterized protein n=2 Tax=Kribbella sancticallisti TaxID=460087 RepID=A0ABN2DXV2_9ACTN